MKNSKRNRTTAARNRKFKYCGAKPPVSKYAAKKAARNQENAK